MSLTRATDMGVAVTALWEAFDQYLSSVTPSKWERDEVKKYKDRLYKVLDAEFGLTAFFQSGSFSNGTGISGRSDVDYFARIPWDQRPQSSTTALTKVREVLEQDLWEATSVSVSRPTVTVVLPGVLAYYEIVPAYYERSGGDDQNVFLIPGPNGTWIESAPKAHLRYVRESNDKHGGSVKGLARLLKAWKYEHSVPISSFYLEVRAAAYGKANDRVFYLTSMLEVIKTLIQSDLAAMNDPTGLVKPIRACSSEANRSASLRALKTARDDLIAARDAWLTNDFWALSAALRRVFGYQFPSVTS